MRYVFDASAIIRAVEVRPRESINVLKSQYTLDIAYYEIGNYIWKLYRRSFISDVNMYIEFFARVLSMMNVERVGLKGDIVDLALKLGLTYYDAAYVWLANKLGAKLVSEDKAVCRAYANCVSVNELFRNSGIG